MGCVGVEGLDTPHKQYRAPFFFAATLCGRHSHALLIVLVIDFDQQCMGAVADDLD